VSGRDFGGVDFGVAGERRAHGSYLNGSSRRPTVGSLCVEYPAVGKNVGIRRPRSRPRPLVHVHGSVVWG
jgi:hypothetical protein